MGNFGAVELSPKVLGKSKLGIWAIEIDEGALPRMYVDDVMLALLGLDNRPSPEDTYNAWYSRVDADYYNEVNDAVNKLVDGLRAEVQYPWHHPDGTIVYVRCGGVRNYSYKNGVRLEGSHQDITDIVHCQKDGSVAPRYDNMSDDGGSMYQDALLRASSGFMKINLSKNIILGEVYDVSESGEPVPINIPKQDNVIYYDVFEKWWAEKMLISDPSEFLRTSNSAHLISEYKKGSRLVEVMCTSKTMDGKVRDGKASYYLSENSDSGDVIAYCIVSDISDREKNKEDTLLYSDMATTLSETYQSIYYVNVVTDDYLEFNSSALYKRLKLDTTGKNFFDETLRNIKSVVVEDDIPRLTEFFDKESLMKKLGNGESAMIEYRLIIDETPYYYRLRVSKTKSNNDYIIISVENVDESYGMIQRQKRIMEQNLQIIEILASEYSSVYYIDLETDQLIPYSMNEETENEFGQIFRSGIGFSEAYKMYVNTVVYEKDRKVMLKAGSVKNIYKELSNKKTFITTYRSDNENEPHYCEMKFVKVGDNDNPKAVALGFADKNTEIRAELEAKRIRERYMAVISGLSEDFGCVVYVDTETNEEIGFRYDELLSGRIPEWTKVNDFTKRMDLLAGILVHPEDKAVFLQATQKDVILKKLKKTGSYYYNFRIVIDDNTVYYQAKFVLDEKDDRYLIAGIRNVDVETRREMEALSKAEDALKAKTIFLNNMSHDIRTPMNAIMGFTDIAIKNIDDKNKVLDSLGKAKASSEHLLLLINDILDMSRIESGKMDINETPIDLLQMIEETTAMFKSMADTKGVHITYVQGQIRDRYVYADRLRVNQIIINIVSNAIKYTDEGGYVNVTLSQLDEYQDGKGIYKTVVEDTGEGMSEEFLEHVFDAFAREKTSTVSRKQGTGLGLAICKRIIDVMGGSIEVESKKGVGSKFTIIMPHRIRQQAQEENVEIKDDSSDFSLEGLKVLLVEDNELNREIAGDMLERGKMIVDEADDGSIAVAKVKAAGPDYYDLILMDIQMPIMDGYEASREIRKIYPDKHIPIIALSANAFEEDRKKSLEAGMDAHQSKPIKMNQLYETIKRVITSQKKIQK